MCVCMCVCVCEYMCMCVCRSETVVSPDAQEDVGLSKERTKEQVCNLPPLTYPLSNLNPL